MLCIISPYLFVLSDERLVIKKSKKRTVTHQLSVKEKKKRFLMLMAPVVRKVHNELMQRYKRIAKDIAHKENREEIEFLKKKYKATSDEDLLARLKPHPVSITLAQAAMESSWATSRFFKEANNVFGMWSSHANEKRIAAGKKRGGTQTIWLRKFDTLEDAIRAYFEMIATGKAYNKFRQLRLEYDDPYKITQGLDKYSEMGEDYTKVLNQVIKFNHLTKYDR
ncbi:glucosaminidase domain-containing protein [Sulfurimonas sp. SWIR-19]|uniref:glucosaminidase domain-containing protein n=1 Tax=Sulfurimonas sp. SWIR-19 TaxID=2878390 RepID=UPI001CF38E7B|nr:glucosaminidase domain-containing protein [Sulfurimonas sp. SWIR-19]UCN00285.1 glucosaminidase domain-containing protein [Sulfurimonas sp. SWIR-19]